MEENVEFLLKNGYIGPYILYILFLILYPISINAIP